KTIKGGSGTRPWRSYFTVHDSLNASFETLVQILRGRNEQHRIFPINTVLLADIVDLMRKFALIFDHLEFSNHSTLQNIVPSYYKMAHYYDKYWPSITTLHWIATYFEPTFKHLAFIDDKKDSEMRKNEIRKGLHVLVNDTLKMNDDDPKVLTSLSSFVVNSPPSKRRKDDPFANQKNQIKFISCPGC
ncbi:unnamed protein product, partial [Didymodactylos carnosus]